MLFNSISFLIFFSIFYGLYRLVNHRFQNYLLLGGGLIFYGWWNPKMTLLLIACILFNYFAGKRVYKVKSQQELIFFITTNLLVLIFFKYAVFLTIAGNDLFKLTGSGFHLRIPDILLPVGISFYTFHNISYLVDVYKERIPIAKNLLSFSIYDLFFPLLLAGPIERAEKLIPQIESPRNVNREDIRSGLWMFSWGIFKKAFIADNLSPFVDRALSPSEVLPEGIIYFVAIAFAFQVYADFSGYTDAARGLARMMGFSLSENFHLPFFSSNPAEFWRRWHISLSTWLRDYIYIPLGGNRTGLFRQSVNLLIVWTLGGLWHGATYGYLLWGIYCGLQIVLYILLREYVITKIIMKNFISKILYLIGIPLTFFGFAFGLLLFRVENHSHLTRILSNLGVPYWNPYFYAKYITIISPILFIQIIQLKSKQMEWYKKGVLPSCLLYSISFIFVVLFVLLSPFHKKEFFYFQF